MDGPPDTTTVNGAVQLIAYIVSSETRTANTTKLLEPISAIARFACVACFSVLVLLAPAFQLSYWSIALTGLIVLGIIRPRRLRVIAERFQKKSFKKDK